MASKLALAAFLVMVGLAQFGARCLVSTGGSAVAAPASDRVAVEAPTVQALGSRPLAPRQDHILWNAACWLFGLGLAVSAVRRGVPQPAP